MNYCESQLDKDNMKWFENDKSCNSLRAITVSNGSIRGITPSRIDFEYPITAVVGENGTGKSTILALATCAFHNDTSFYPRNKIRSNSTNIKPYYTYNDFFTFTKKEDGIINIEIISEYLTKNGIHSDTRKKYENGKWNNYDSRPKRIVSYLGINRIVPPSESKTHRNYARYFQKVNTLEEQQLDKLTTALSLIFGKNYTGIDLMKYNSYHLFKATRSSLEYTGFNMGAGENAVLELLTEIMLAGKGSLIVIDEIELGLHAKAQLKLIEILKKWCCEYHCQIICSTHSSFILDSIPLQGRLFLSRTNGNLDIIPEISSSFAFEKLSGRKGLELDVFVEDDMGKAFLSNIIPCCLRERVNIMIIGSCEAIIRSIASHYREKKYNFIAFFDGDQRTLKQSQLGKIKKALETKFDQDEKTFDDFINKRLNYLPGSQWPERVIVDAVLNSEFKDELVNDWNLDSIGQLVDELNQAKISGTHNEFYVISEALGLSKDTIRSDMIKFYKKHNEQDVQSIVESIKWCLDNKKL